MDEPLPKRRPIPDSPLWLGRRHLLWLAAFLAFAVLLLGLGFMAYERREAEVMHTAQTQQYARLLEQQTSDNIAAVETTVRSISDFLEDLTTTKDFAGLTRFLEDSVRRRPNLRSLSVLDHNGRVIASSNPGNLDTELDFGVLGGLPTMTSSPQLGPILIGRDLSDLKVRSSGPSGLNVLPMLRRVNPVIGQELTVVALINVDRFSAKYELTLDDRGLRVALVGFDGELLVATSNLEHAMGSSLKELPVFADFLPKIESGSYIGIGVDHLPVFTAFRASRLWPLVVLVERSYEQAMAEVKRLAQWTLAIVVCAWLLIAILTFLALRSLRRHAAVSAQLRLADEEIFASEARHLAVLESSLDGVLTIDSAGCIVSFNPAAERIFGRERNEVLGKPMHEFLVPAHLRSDHRKGIKRYLESGDGPVLGRMNRRMETTGMRSDESVFPMELTIVSLRVEGEVFFTANVRDISEKIKIEQEKATLLGRYRELARDLELQKRALDEHAIVCIVDTQDRIIYANDKLVDISGYPREELIGISPKLFLENFSSSQYAAVIERLMLGNTWHGELTHRRRDGRLFWVANTTVPVFSEDGKLRQLINIQTDISELRQTQFALEESRQREVEVGNRIQQSLLSASPAQQLPNLWLSHFNQPSKGIDGDFVDVIRIGDHIVDIIAGDVMGKGVPAALMGAATKLQFSRSIAELLASSRRESEPPKPSEIVSAVHKAMTPHLQALDAFVTLAYIRIDTLRDVISWVGCGHEETLLMRAQEDSIYLPNQHPPLGVLDDSDYTQNEASMVAGDSVFLCSDGLTDAIQPEGEFIGRNLVNASARQLVRDHPTPAAALHSLRRLLLHETVQVKDDVTMVLIKRVAADDLSKRYELPISHDSIRALRQFITEDAGRAGLAEEETALLVIASVEVFTNIVRHCHGLLANAPLETVTKISPHEFVVELIHLGDAFTPPSEPVESDFADFPEGGFGLTIIQRACDRVDYLHRGGVTTVRLVRYLTP